MARIAALEAVVAELRVLLPSRPAPTDRDRATLAEIVAVVLDDTPFQCGDLVDDPATAKRWGECLARLLPHSPVDDVHIERLAAAGHRSRGWRLRYVEPPAT